MKSFVIVATKGRARDALALVDFIERQTMRPKFTIFVGTENRDIEGINSHPFIKEGNGVAVISPRVGLTAQRNYGLEYLEKHSFFADRSQSYFCVFFDDDYRMSDDWIELSAKRFSVGDIVGITGCVLGDGVKKGGYDENYALSLLKGDNLPETHWSSGKVEKDIDSVYGCNMAFVDKVISNLRFDENTPLYAWLEDRDYTGGAKQYGRVIYYPGCKGVHLGSQSGGRTNGLRFGYSQIANPYYFYKKGTMDLKSTIKLTGRALASNTLHSILKIGKVDYPGRLHGNLIALTEFIKGRIHPMRILSL